MERSEIVAQLKTLIKPYIDSNITIEGITEESDLLTDLHINSAYLVDIVLDIENEFDIMIEDDVISKMTTVGASVDIINDLLG